MKLEKISSLSKWANLFSEMIPWSPGMDMDGAYMNTEAAYCSSVVGETR